MQRLSGLDASFLYFETRAQLLHVCGLIVVDPSTMPGGYSYEGLREEMSRRVAGMPGFRRKLHDSMLNVDHPVWIEADDFDIDHHLHRIAVPSPGGDEELATLCAHLASLPMDRSMPLWEMFVIEGLADGGVAIFAKMHHATVDGVSGANMMSQLCTLTPDDPSLDAALVEENAGGAGTLELAVGGVFSRLTSPLKLASLLPGTVKLLPSWVKRARKGLAMPAPFTAPRTPFNRTITGHRSMSFSTVALEDIKRVKNAFGTTVNDVVLAVCATALRGYLEEVGELPGKPLIAMVPMSVHDADPRPGTNRVSGMFMSLATDIADPIERLEVIRDHNVIAKDHNKAIDANLLTDWAQFAAPSVFGSAVRMYSRLRLAEHHPVVHNLVISNVPGPNFPLYFLGCRISKMLPMGPVFHGAGLNCTVMSLDGDLHVGFIACKELVPDLWPLADRVPEALDEYVAAAAAREAATERASRPVKKAPAKKTAAKKSAAKKSAAKKTAASKKSAAKKSAAKKSAAKKTAAAKKSAAAKKNTSTTSAAKKTATTTSTRAKPTGSPPSAGDRRNGTSPASSSADRSNGSAARTETVSESSRPKTTEPDMSTAPSAS